MNNILELKKINFQIEEKNILEDINFSVKKWEIFNILWHNWSWKTSLLKSIIWLNQIEKTLEGKWEILFENNWKFENISELEIFEKSWKWISYIMQEIPEYTWISVKNYVEKILEKSWKIFLDWWKILFEDCEIFFDVKKLFLDFWLDFDKYKERYFDSHLSWWERKKIEIITNFLMDKDLYLLDEIEASLDATSRDVLIKLIKKENVKWKTFIIVSHSKDILELAENWILLCNWKIQEEWKNNILLKKYFWECEKCEEKNNCEK